MSLYKRFKVLIAWFLYVTCTKEDDLVYYSDTVFGILLLCVCFTISYRPCIILACSNKFHDAHL